MGKGRIVKQIQALTTTLHWTIITIHPRSPFTS